MTPQEINSKILELKEDSRNEISDGYHSFGELYEHRCRLFIAFVNLAHLVLHQKPCVKSKKHADDTSFDGWFILQSYIEGKQISYHLPMKYRDNVRCKESDLADEWDGHTSDDVLERLFLI